MGGRGTRHSSRRTFAQPDASTPDAARSSSARDTLHPPPAARVTPPPHPPPRTKWTRRVPHPVLIGHAASASLARGSPPAPASPPTLLDATLNTTLWGGLRRGGVTGWEEGGGRGRDPPSKTCPVSTGRGTRRVQLVRGGKRGGCGVETRRARSAAHRPRPTRTRAAPRRPRIAARSRQAATGPRAPTPAACRKPAHKAPPPALSRRGRGRAAAAALWHSAGDHAGLRHACSQVCIKHACKHASMHKTCVQARRVRLVRGEGRGVST